jgi:hypothetical protein
MKSMGFARRDHALGAREPTSSPGLIAAATKGEKSWIAAYKNFSIPANGSKPVRDA